MSIENLKVFVTVAEQRHFSRAAEVLHLSQPGVSSHIRNLENEFGAKLLHRSPKQVKLTEAGTVLYKQAKQILAYYEEARQRIQQLQQEVTGTLHVGASFTIGEYVLPRLLAEYVDLYPMVDVQVQIGNTEEIVRGVRSHQLDIGLVEGQIPFADMATEPFMKDEMVLVSPVGHALTHAALKRSRPSIAAEALHDQVWIVREAGSGTRDYSDRLLLKLGLRVKRMFVFGSSQGVKEAVMAGLGIAVLSRWVVRKELAAGELAELRLEGRHEARTFTIVRSREAVESMAAAMFLHKVKETGSVDPTVG